MRTSKTLDLTQGSVSKKLLAFVIPLILSNLLQQLYNVADRVVVGKFAENGTFGLAAVGSTSAATTMFLSLFSGLAIGTNVICSNMRGAKNQLGLERCMHTSMLMALVCGLGIGMIGFIFCKPLLVLMGTKEEVLDLATLYMRIYFMGSPASIVYNFGANILRAHGDTKRPMYILAVTGMVNVLLNLVLVIGCHRNVDGVAIATITAQYISAISVLVILFSPKGTYKMKLRKLRIHGQMAMSVIRVGVPCGLNSMVFTVSNVILQTAVNTYEPYMIAGKTAASDISTLLYQIIVAFYAGSVSFSGQCYGAGNYKRIDKLFVKGTLLCWSFMISISVLCTLFPRQLLSLFNDDPRVIEAGVSILLINCWGYLLYTVSETALGCLRGMKESTIPSLLNFLGICVPRIIWAMFVFPQFQDVYTTDMAFLFLCYPISWIISAGLQLSYYLICRRKLKKRVERQAAMNT